MKLEKYTQEQVAFGALSLVVSCARSWIQYGRLPTESIGYFLGHWFVHYIALAIVAGLTYWLYQKLKVRIYYKPPDLSLEQVGIIVFLSVAVSCIGIVVVMAMADGAGVVDDYGQY